MVTIRSSSSEVISPALFHIVSLLCVIFLFPSVDIPLVEVDIGLLANQVGISTTDTLDAGQGVHDLLLAIDVGVEETENELDCACVSLWLEGFVLGGFHIQFDFSPLTRAAHS
jgi:hypothetical protein